MSSSDLLKLYPFDSSETQWIDHISKNASPFKLGWLSGFFAAKGLDNSGFAESTSAPVESVTQTTRPATILYASQTGNAQAVAEQLWQAQQSAGVAAELVNVRDFKPSRLKEETTLIFVTSTQGEGEPPESAESFFKFLQGKKAPNLSHLSYAVLGLGDSSYEFFCQAAMVADQRLSELGAHALAPLQTLDVDYEADAEIWIKHLTQELKTQVATAPGLVVDADKAAAVSNSVYNKKNPFVAELLTNQRITSARSDKDIRHLEISLESSGLSYQPGDTLGVYFENDPNAVNQLLKTLNLTGQETVLVADETIALRQALIEKLELTQSYPSFVKQYVQHGAEGQSNADLIKLVEGGDALRSYITDRQIYDIIAEHPCQIEAQTLVDILRKQQPRLYSISSAQSEVDEEVHITVRKVEYDAFGQAHLGGASGYLSKLQPGDKLRVYLQASDFKLPQDPSAPVIMIGPGTGIAPFRGFLQQREQTGAVGKNWLFFGNSHFCDDFLYQSELQAFINRGVLTRLNTAFSRDQAEKIYVQQRLQQEAQAVFEWLQQGAYVYVCGDANRMAKDVHQALINLISEQGNMGLQQAESYLDQLQQANRYQKDVY